MADDPEEYLRRAIECERLSQTLPDAISCATFAAMAKTWRQLACQLRKDKLKDDQAKSGTA